VPVLLSVVHLVKPSFVRGGSSALFAVLAVLQMLATDTFHNMAKSDLADRSSSYKKGSYIAVVGFGLLSALSLLIILLESFIGHKEPTRHVDAGGKMPGAQQPAVQV
jgi:hypothetical protein